MTGGQALVKSLCREGITEVFGLPGAGQYEAVDALYEEPSIRYISTRHEQATSYMADGYARASGKIAAVLVVPGPGLFNAAAGMATAAAASSPMLVISGGRHHKNGEAESDEMVWLRPLSKWVGRADRPADIPSLVHQAMGQLKRGRPQPVAVEIPPEVFAAVEEVSLVEAEIYQPPAGDRESIRQAAQILMGSKRPLIWAGAGVQRSDASEELQTLAEHLQAPVVTTRQGKGALSNRHPLYLGLAEPRYKPLNDWLDRRDMILAVGTSRDFTDFEQKVVVINADENAARPGERVLNIVADAGPSLKTLYREVVALEPARTEIAAEVQAEIQNLNRERFDPAHQLQPQWDLMRAVRSAMPDDGILVQGMNQMGYYSRNYFPVYAPRSYLTPSSHITLGCAFPLALGAKLSAPNRAVVALSGDGGFLYNAQELATAVQYDIPVVVIVFNDNAYGNVLRAQIEQFDGHVIGTRLHNPDFVQLARSFGANGVTADGAEELESALRQALEIEAPTLIEVPVGMMEREF